MDAVVYASFRWRANSVLSGVWSDTPGLALLHASAKVKGSGWIYKDLFTDFPQRFRKLGLEIRWVIRCQEEFFPRCQSSLCCGFQPFHQIYGNYEWVMSAAKNLLPLLRNRFWRQFLSSLWSSRSAFETKLISYVGLQYSCLTMPIIDFISQKVIQCLLCHQEIVGGLVAYG